MTHKAWHQYFLSNRHHFANIGWPPNPELSANEVRLITKAIQQFQRGENSEGKHLIRFAKQQGDPSYLDSFLLHFKVNYSHPGWWNGDYRAVGHWVPQFGMFALISTFYDVPDTSAVD